MTDDERVAAPGYQSESCWACREPLVDWPTESWVVDPTYRPLFDWDYDDSTVYEVHVHKTCSDIHEDYCARRDVEPEDDDPSPDILRAWWDLHAGKSLWERDANLLALAESRRWTTGEWCRMRRWFIGYPHLIIDGNDPAMLYLDEPHAIVTRVIPACMPVIGEEPVASLPNHVHVDYRAAARIVVRGGLGGLEADGGCAVVVLRRDSSTPVMTHLLDELRVVDIEYALRRLECKQPRDQLVRLLVARLDAAIVHPQNPTNTRKP